jgi:hypothetical protein
MLFSQKLWLNNIDAISNEILLSIAKQLDTRFRDLFHYTKGFDKSAVDRARAFFEEVDRSIFRF